MMLSDAKLRAIAIEHGQPWRLVDKLCRAISEASEAAERERLMDVVCSFCGKKEVEHTMSEHGLACPCPRGGGVGFFMESSLAEYLRLHPRGGGAMKGRLPRNPASLVTTAEI